MVKKLAYSLIPIILILILIVTISKKAPKHPDAGLDVVELITRHGYPVETHEIVTDDDYIITLYRIPNGRKQFPHRTPILLTHGAGQSSFNFLVLGPDKALTYQLVENGFDVWLQNSRSSTWSRKHRFLNPDTDEQYFNFTMHEVATYDIPACIDHILAITGQESLHYLGFSQGSLLFFLMGSERPEYLKKIRLMTALAPAVYMKNTNSWPLHFVTYHWDLLEIYHNLFNIHEVVHRESLFAQIIETFCNENSILGDLCVYAMYLTFGYSPEEINKDIISLEFSQCPAGTSRKMMIHHFQMIKSGVLTQYDYGEEGNLKIYGREEPPLYHINNVSTPVAVYYSSTDILITKENLEKFTKSIPNIVKIYKVPADRFSHFDFTTGKNANRLLYDSILEELLKY